MSQNSSLGYLLSPTFQIINTAGRPLTGGYINVYIHGSRDRYYCASDFSGTLHPFNIPLDSLGSNIVLASLAHSYDIYVMNRYGSQIMSRYNVIPATNGSEAITDIVNITSNDGTVNISSSSGTDWDLSIKDTADQVAQNTTDISDIKDALDDKKDKQSELIYGGNDHMTITKIKQNENGEITEVKYEPIDLPPEVPNVDIISSTGNIQIASSINVQTNTKTFDLNVNSIEPEWHYWTGNNAWTYITSKTWTEINRPAIGAGSTGHTWNPTIKKGIYDVKSHFTVTFHNADNSKVIPNQIIQVGFRAKFVGKNDPTAIRYEDLGSWTYDPSLYTDEPYEYNFAQSSIRQNNDTSKILNVANYWGDTDFDVYFEAALLNTDGEDTGPSPIDTVLMAEINYFGYHEIKGSVNESGSGSDIIIGREYNGVLDDTYDGIKLRQADNNNEVVGLRKNNNWYSYGQLAPLSAGANKALITNSDGTLSWGVAGSGINIDNNGISTDIQVQNAEKVNIDLEFGQTIQTVNLITTDGSTIRTDGFNFKMPDIIAGDGIDISASGNEYTISMDSEVGDVVGTVEKLKKDLDTQITTNFDMPNISQVYDFADPSVSTLTNGACMLCQSFTIPINHEIRTLSDDADTPTLLGIYAQQNFAHKIMLALYEYTYAAEGEEHGSSTYVGDTGPVNVAQGVNEFPLKNRNPSITELRSDKVYYATLYLPSTALVNGLFLAGAPNYGNASIPAEPRLSCGVDNITWDGSELDMTDPTTTLNHYQEVIIPGQDPYYQYYIGPWNSGYNERWTAPRFYMQIRNGEFNVPVVPTTPFVDLGDALPRGTLTQTDIPSFTPSQANSAFRDVTPLLNVTITSFEWIDGMSTYAGWAAANCVFDSGFSTNLSGVSNSIVDLGQVVTGQYPGYAHRITFTTPLTLTAGTTYRFLCGCTDGSPYFKVWLDPTNVIYFGNNGWYVDISNILRDEHHAGMYNKLYDSNNNSYVI